MSAQPAMCSYVAKQGGTRGRYEDALEALLANRGDPSRDVDQLLAEHPESILGHCLRAGLIVRSDDAGARPKLLESLNAIEAACTAIGEPARYHAYAARAWYDGNQTLALERYASILVEFPRDILALAVAHALDFRLGRRRMLRDRVGQSLPEWHPAIPGYASLLAMYAFGLEENGQYRRAEKMARRALAADPRHLGAIHVVTHVMEMQGRAREGLEFLAATEWAWMDAPSISVHLAWHRALFYLDIDDSRSALKIYDAQIVMSQVVSGLADASALLWRLELRNVRLGNRWHQLADRWETQDLIGVRPFYIAHAVMAFAASRRAAATQRVLGLLAQLKAQAAGSTTYGEDALIPPLCKALLAFADGDYVGCAESLKHVRHMANRCGGSLAQCDLVHLTLTEARLRANKGHPACEPFSERTLKRPSNRFNRRLHHRFA